MTTLFRRLQPHQKFRITVYAIAQLLKIPKHKIVRVECWAYVVFVHRRDVGGQFISYRKLRQWLNAVACQIQNCSTWQQLRPLWLAIEEDCKRHKKQYDDKHQPLDLLQKYKAPHPNPPLIKGRELVSPLDKGGLRGVNSTFARGLLLCQIWTKCWDKLWNNQELAKSEFWF